MQKNIIGLRIMQRRKELGLTQEELANKMGYKSKSTINKIEKCINDVSQSNVLEFAKVLHTTEAYLMGKTNNPDPNLIITTPVLQETINKLMAAIPSTHIKLPDDVIFDDDENENTSEENSTIEFEDISKAFDFYKKYKNAIPQIQEAIRNLLKVDESDP